MGYNWKGEQMRKAAIIITIVTSLLITSCTKINGESESWFIDNGWIEGILEYGNSYGEIGMQIDASGNIIGIFKTSGYYYNHGESWWEFRLYSAFDQVKELTSAPTDGYVGNFYAITLNMVLQEIILVLGPTALTNLGMAPYAIHITNSI